MGITLAASLREYPHVELPALKPAYPEPIIDPKQVQLSGRYDASVTSTPVLYEAQLSIPDWLRHGRVSTYVVHVRHDTTPDPFLANFYAKHPGYKPQKFRSDQGLVSISREPFHDLPKSFVEGLDEDQEDFRYVINTQGWLRGSDRISIERMRNGGSLLVLPPTYVDKLLEQQHAWIKTIERADRSFRHTNKHQH